jgi:hypothetical protein
MIKRIVCLVAVLACLMAVFSVSGEEIEYYTLCQPESHVNARKTPRMRAEIVGRLELGDKVWSDGAKRNGFLHVYGPFECDCWVYAGFLVPEITVQESEMFIQADKVACRRSINGRRRKWMYEGDRVKVFAFSDDWAITDQGFIMIRFLGGD